MGMLAIACGALIVAFGLLTTRRAPSDAQFGVEITCLVGGLVLIFLGIVLRRLDRVMRRVEGKAGKRQGEEQGRIAPGTDVPPNGWRTGTGPDGGA